MTQEEFIQKKKVEYLNKFKPWTEEKEGFDYNSDFWDCGKICDTDDLIACEHRMNIIYEWFEQAIREAWELFLPDLDCEPDSVLLMSHPPKYQCKRCGNTWTVGESIDHGVPKCKYKTN